MTTAVDALRINPPALAQKVNTELGRSGADPAPIMLLRVRPEWPYDTTLSLPGGREAQVAVCTSLLALWEQVVNHRNRSPLVLLTDLDEATLDDSLLGQVHRHRIVPIEPWDLVLTCFGAQRLDPRLRDETWAGEALLDAMPASGWPPLAGGMLSRDDALRQLAVERLGMAEIGVDAPDLDAHALMRWSTLPDAGQRLDQLRAPERDGLVRWLESYLGAPGRALFALAPAGHVSDALALGLVCDSVWPQDGATPLDVPGVRAQGAVSHHFGANLSDATIRAFAAVSTTVVTEAINDSGAASSSHPQKGTARRHRVVARLVLDRAEQLLVTFNATQTAACSRVLRSGFAARVNGVATALRQCLTEPDDDSIRRLAASVHQLSDHCLADAERHRVDRARMALRLARWVRTPVATPESVADGIQRHIDEWSWVDRAHHDVWSGDDADLSLQSAYRDLCSQVHERRRELDRAFANRLAAWTDSGAPAGDLLTVESLLARVVSPVVHGTDRSALLVILDGMSVAAASELAEGLEQDGWVEYDPVAGDGQPHRRGVVAALPTITEVSRASLLAGELCAGDKHDEKRYFERQSLWRGKPAMIFHDSDVHGGAGEVITPALEEALGHTDTLVSVVLNTIDDTLGPGREGNEPGWRLDNIKSLRLLLQRAGYHGRAVVITSDHGHILEQQGTLQRAPDSISARHRSGAAPPGAGEVLLRGDRVVADGNRVVALWDTSLRYQRVKAGYHGGASLAEVTVPLLAYLPGGATPPKGWTAIVPARPPWWDTPHLAPSPATPAPPARPARQASPQGRKRPATQTGDTLFDIPPSTPAVSSGAGSQAGDQSASAASNQAAALVAELLESEMFVEQSGLAPRRMAAQKIAKAVTALLDAGGGLPLAVLAERAGEQVSRAPGFATTLQRILNVDNFPVLSIVDNGRTARLDPVLLRQQFGLSGAAR